MKGRYKKRAKVVKTRYGKLELLFNSITNHWKMTGGAYGSHGLYEPCYNERVSAHWLGYIVNNGLTPGPGSHGGIKSCG